ncbi:MAG: glutamate--cysteine ligase [Myxococcales bacterium]|nr:glutamate--cysteine ligase [Myxococcales bacterium]MCB9550553.1 glutamate--cysteine ligase [Myxococcales bacterium]
MSSLVDDDATLLEDPAQCVEYMAAGGKPRERWVIGTEHEKLGWWPDRGTYPTWDDPRGIRALLEALAAEGGWTATREGEAIVALARGRATVTLEPGGQLELSGAPLPTLAETAAELDAHFEEVRRFSAPLGITWSGLGLAPSLGPDAMPRMPKARYEIMRRYLPTRGALASRMMHQTCTVQANLDFADEADAFRKLRLSLWVQPFVLAAWANSPIVEGRPVVERTFRGRIWEATDDDRWRYPARFLEPGCTFADYVEWAFGVPMFFLRREGRAIDCAGLVFRDFVEKGHGGYRANLGDFIVHLSTLFPDARLKRYLEVRGADMGDRDHVLALPAFHAGLLYDAESLDDALALFEGVDPAELARCRRMVPVMGLGATLGGATLQEYGKTLLDLARAGLARREPGAVGLLDPVVADVAAGRCPADRVRAAFDGDVGKLLAATRIC